MPENFRRAHAHSREDMERVPPVTEQTLDLTNLTEQEAKIIQSVLQRDEQERNILETKISEVRKEIQEIRKAGALTAGDDQNAICARCKFKFGALPWADQGQRCMTCKFRVCAKCRSKQSNGRWLCILCSKYRQEKLLTGEWCSHGESASLQGSDLLRASLRHRSQEKTGYEDVDGFNYTQRPAKCRDADSESRTSKNSQSSNEQPPPIADADTTISGNGCRHSDDTIAVEDTFSERCSDVVEMSTVNKNVTVNGEEEGKDEGGGEGGGGGDYNVSASKDASCVKDIQQGDKAEDDVSAENPAHQRLAGLFLESGGTIPRTPSPSTSPNLREFRYMASPKAVRKLADIGIKFGSLYDPRNLKRVGNESPRSSAAKDLAHEVPSTPPHHLRVLGASYLGDTDHSHSDDANSSLSLDIGKAEINSNMYSSNSMGDHTLYYDDLKGGNRSLCHLSPTDSMSSSSLCSDYGNNPKYKSLKPSKGTSELELFRKRGERYSIKKKKALEEQSSEDPNDIEDLTPHEVQTITSRGRRISVHTNNEWIPHWHETLRRQSVVEMTVKHFRPHPHTTVPSPILSVTPPVEDGIFSLVKPRRPKLMRSNDPNYLSPDHSREDSSSSQESISACVEAVKSLASEAEHEDTQSDCEQDLSSMTALELDISRFVAASTPKAERAADRTSLAKVDEESPKSSEETNAEVSLPNGQNILDATLDHHVQTRLRERQDFMQFMHSKSRANGDQSRDAGMSLPTKKVRRSGYGATVPHEGWNPFEGVKGKRKLPTVANIPERGEQRADEKTKLAPGQRRESYSRALENQKVTVIPHAGKKRGDRASSSEDEDMKPLHAHPDVEPLKLGRDRDSDSSSVVSYTDSHNASSSISTNQDVSSEDNKSMSGQSLHDGHTNHAPQVKKTSSLREKPAALPSKFRFRRSSSSDTPEIRRDESFERSDDDIVVSSMNQTMAEPKPAEDDHSTKEKSENIPQSTESDASSAGDPRLRKRKDSFEEVYNSNVNRLVEMMTGGQAVAMMEEHMNPSARHKRDLPVRPSNGKSKRLLLQQSLSLSEEMAENIKYQSSDDDDNGDNNDNSGEGIDDKEELMKCDTSLPVEEPKVAEEKLLLPSQIKKQQSYVGANQGPFSPTSSTPTKDASNKKATLSKKNVFIEKDEVLEDQTETSPAKINISSPDDEPFTTPHTQTSIQPSPIGPQYPLETIEESQQKNTFLKPILKKSHPPEVKEQLDVVSRARDSAMASDARAHLFRTGSNVSDTLSIITEMSEPYGEAESLPYDSDGGSDGTLHDRNFDESFSDDNDEDELQFTQSSVRSFRENANVVQGEEDDMETPEGDDSYNADANSETDVSGDLDDMSRSMDTIKDVSDLEHTRHSYEDSDQASILSIHQEDSNPEGYVIEREPSINSQISDLDSEKEFRGSEWSVVSRESTESGRHIETNRDKDQEKPISENEETSEFGESLTEQPESESTGLKDEDEANQKDPKQEDSEIIEERKMEEMVSSEVNDDEPDSSNIETAGNSGGRAEDQEPKMTLLAMVQKQQAHQEGGLVYDPNSYVPDAHVDLDEEVDVGSDSTSCSSRGGAGFWERAHGPQNDESVRDSDSGVNTSSHTSRTTTPEQRGGHHNNQLHVPAIAVTNSGDERAADREEDDDIDELFNNHRPHMLGSRSSLADSRESIYSVYSDAGELNYGRFPVTGEIMFHLSYNYKNNTLEIHIKGCRDLAPVDTKHKRSDPYVKTYLLPDKTRGSKRKTKIKKHTLSPTYDEVLKYSISKSELESRILSITVCNNDKFGRNDFLGEVTIPLDYYRFEDSTPRWYPLQERAAPQETMMSYKGDLFISLKYVPADMVETSPKKKSGSFRKKSKDKDKSHVGLGEVHVLVREAQNLTAMRAAAGSNPFCKGYLLPDVNHSSKQKTPVIKKTTNPQWQHILVFDGVEQSKLHEHGLELTIWDHEKLSSNDFLGGVRLNLGQGTYQGKPADWMDARGEEIEAWQSMMEHLNEWVDAQLPLRASMGKQNVKK